MNSGEGTGPGPRRRNRVLAGQQRIHFTPGIKGPGHRALAASRLGGAAVAPLRSSCAGSARSIRGGVPTPCKRGCWDCSSVGRTTCRKVACNDRLRSPPVAATTTVASAP
eukprot:15460499-Alexandrium_andersonii.AAC.2